MTMKILAAVLTLGAISATGSVAQDFPGGAVTIVVPAPPGGSNDLFGRRLAEGLQDLWDVPVVVQNMPGAASVIGAAHVVKSRPDGRTILLTSGSFTINSAVETGLPFDPRVDMAPVAMVGEGALVAAVGDSSGIKTVEDLVAASQTETLLYASNGKGSTGHVAAEVINLALGIKMEPVFYSGGTESMMDVISGRVHMYVGTPTTILPLVGDGRAFPLAALGQERAIALPETLTFAEQGVEGISMIQWWGVFATGETPPETVALLNSAINEVMSQPGQDEWARQQGAVISTKSVEDFRDFYLGELDRFTALAIKIGLRQE